MRLSRVNGSLAVLAGAMLCLDAAAASLGWWMRPVADSWCTAVQVRDQGVFPTAWQMYAHENGRLAAAVANSVSGLHNGAMERVFPALTIVLALAAAWWLYGELRRTVVTGLSQVAVVTLAATTAAGSMLLGRSAYQSFLWAPGAITHTWPPLIAMFAIAGGLRVAGLGVAGLGGGRAWAPVGAAIAFLASTFDEVTAVLMLSVAAVALADRRAWRRDAPAWVVYVRGCVLGVLSGVVVLDASPGFHSRSGASHPTVGLLAGSVTDAARWLLDFVAQWPLLALVAIAIAVGFRSAAGRAPARPLARRVLIAPAAVVLITLLVDVAALRVGYGPSGPATTPRAYSEFFVPAVFATAFYCLLLGRMLAQRVRLASRGVALAAALGVAAIAVGMFGLVRQTYQLADVLSTRAHTWDAQNARVQRAARDGVRVVQYTPLPVAGLVDPFWLAGYHDWVAGCVKSYYHVATLRDGRYVR